MDYLTVTVLYLLQFILSADTNTQNVLSQDKIIRGGGGVFKHFMFGAMWRKIKF